MDPSDRIELAVDLASDAHFCSLKNTPDSIRYFLKKVKSYEELKQSVKDKLNDIKSDTAKNLQLATNYRQEAEWHFQHTGQLHFCLHSVHQALLHFPLSSNSEMALLYGLKAAVHYRLREYTAMLYSAEMAIELEAISKENNSSFIKYRKVKIQALGLLRQYATAIRLIDDLLAEEKKGVSELADLRTLKKRLQDDGKVEDEVANSNLELNSSSDPPLLNKYNLDDRCSIVSSPTVGRHFIASEDIPESSIILREKPYSSLLETDFFHQRCTACHRQLKYRFFPCFFCTDVIFCNMICFDAAWKGESNGTKRAFHRAECGFAGSLVDTMLNMQSAHVFRILSQTGPLEALKMAAEIQEKGYSVEQYMREQSGAEKDETQKEQSKVHHFKMAASLCNHSEKVQTGLAFSNTSTAHHIVLALKVVALLDIVHNDRFGESLFKDDNNNLLIELADFALHFIRRLVFNVFGWQTKEEGGGGKDEQIVSIGHCLCLVGSLVNHSCAPNTIWSWSPQGEIVFTSKQAISKGQQITISYGPYWQIDYEKRQTTLNQYLFACRCELCSQELLRRDHLRCRHCTSGLVPFNSPLNKSPYLKGRCINCYQAYENVEEATEKLSEVQSQIQSLASLSKLISFPLPEEVEDDIQVKAIKLLEQLLLLSSPECESVSVSVSTCLEVMARYLQNNKGDQLKIGKNQLASLICRTLPKFSATTKVVPNCSRINGKYLRSLGFWSSSFSILDEDTASQFGELLSTTWKQLLEDDDESGSVSDRLMSILGEHSFSK